MPRPSERMRWVLSAALCSALAASILWPRGGLSATGDDDGYLFNDSHVHLTNYIQEGPDVRDYIATMGNKIGRSALFGIPLQQTWAYANSGDFAPTYYLQTDAPLYYYSFTDAVIAEEYLSLSPADRQRLDPMITGFNPADMYGVDHIRRVLETFPGVFTGIGEFTIHKEFVSSKVAGAMPHLTDPALDRILDFAAEAGLLVIMHSDIDMPFAQTEHGTRLSQADEGRSDAPSQNDDHLGAHRARSCCPPVGSVDHGRRAGTQSGPCRDARGATRGSCILASVFRHFVG